jgi:hypothetical protein
MVTAYAQSFSRRIQHSGTQHSGAIVNAKTKSRGLRLRAKGNVWLLGNLIKLTSAEGRFTKAGHPRNPFAGEEFTKQQGFFVAVIREVIAEGDPHAAFGLKAGFDIG